MAQNFMISVQAVLPLFFMMMLGVLVRRFQWLNESELARLNSVVFKLLFPFTVFSSIYHTDLSSSFYPKLILYCVAAVLITFLVSLFLVPRFEKNNKSRGAIIQAIYRSNFVLLGLPLVSNIYPNADLGMTAIVIAVLIPVFNVLAVATLETFRGGVVKPKRILLGILTNPLILGTIAGILASPISLPTVLDNTVSQLASAAIPIALILLGASFQSDRSPSMKRNLVICVLSRLVIVPGIFLTIAALLGFRGIGFITLLGVFATPCAISSYTMAVEMESDGDLAGAVVIYSSMFSCLTLFLWTFLFKQLAIF